MLIESVVFKLKGIIIVESREFSSTYNQLKCQKQMASNFSSNEPNPSLNLELVSNELSRDF
jgi:hypothetical protein